MPVTKSRSRSNASAASLAPTGQATKNRRGCKPRPIVEFPDPLTTDWIDPPAFADAFALHLQRHGDTVHHLSTALSRPGDLIDRKMLRTWATGVKLPSTARSFETLARIERRYRLPNGYFQSKIAGPHRAMQGRVLTDIEPVERRRLAWHLPDDFDHRSPSERAEILEWVRRVIISGSTDYRRFQAEAMKVRYAIRFPDLYGADHVPGDDIGGGTLSDRRAAPAALTRELGQLLRFKSATLTDIGVKRSGVWGAETVAQKTEHLALMFGALAADPTGSVRGGGVPADCLTLVLLAIPAVWDWYLAWREARRGFFTNWEVDMLSLGAALTRRETGWLRQSPYLAARLRPIAGLVGQADIDLAIGDWDRFCDVAAEHALARIGQIKRVVRVHRDPFEPILAVLEDESPVSVYRRITTEILKRLPDERRYPKAVAEAMRGYLMLRLGLHLGVRQKNLRQLLVSPRGTLPRSDRQLEALKCGELRWSAREPGWEVVIPSIAFKNANSSFFGRQAYRLLLPDLEDLYAHIAAYVGTHRPLLLNGADDPGTFFVKSVKRSSTSAAYDQNTFYEAWRLVTQRHGIFNPYTGRGAIKGLLPHGPHNVRDVLATHILKRTGSYEQASYAIQDTPDMVAKHYGRFLPQDKTALAARILNQVWEVA